MEISRRGLLRGASIAGTGLAFETVLGRAAAGIPCLRRNHPRRCQQPSTN